MFKKIAKWLAEWKIIKSLLGMVRGKKDKNKDKDDGSNF